MLLLKNIWLKRAMVFIVGFILTVYIFNFSMVFLSNTYQKTICMEHFCLKKPKDWIVALTKRENKIYMFDLIHVKNTGLSDFYLDKYKDGVILKKESSKIVIYKYKGKGLFDERFTPQYKVKDKIYYMKKEDDSTFAIYPEKKIVIFIEDHKFSLDLIEQIILNTTLTKKVNKVINIDSKKITFTKDVLLAIKYYKGLNVPIDYKLALFHLNKALKYENRIAQYMLGSMHQEGIGVEKNNTKAVSFYNMSAKQGYINALYSLGYMYEKGLGGLKANNCKAASLYQKPSDNGYAPAQHALALVYQEGKCRKINYNKAMVLYKKAEKQKFIHVYNDLGVMYYNGYGTTKNIQKSYEYWMLASKNGDTHATNNLNFLCKEHKKICIHLRV